MQNESLIAAARMITEFRVAFEHNPSVELALTLVAEESTELHEAFALDLTDDTIGSLENVLKEGCDLAYVYLGAISVLQQYGLMFQPEIAEKIEGTIGLVVDTFGEEKFVEAFTRVHQSNMSKLDDDGKPLRREDGKVLKGPNYAPPSLTDLVLEQYLSTARGANEAAA